MAVSTGVKNVMGDGIAVQTVSSLDAAMVLRIPESNATMAAAGVARNARTLGYLATHAVGLIRFVARI